MREELLGYVLGALEPEEAAAIEARLQSDPELQREVERLRLLVDPLTAAKCLFDPPKRLADRVCREIAEMCGSNLGPADAAASLPAGGAMLEGSVAGAWRRLDGPTLVGLALAAVVLLVPLISASRNHAQATACRERLQQVGRALLGYSTSHAGLFPKVSTTGNFSRAGVYAVELRNAGYLPDERSIYCPSSVRAPEQLPSLPTTADLAAASPDEAAGLYQRMNGAFGYALGYVDGDRYLAVRNLNRSDYAVLADSPSEHGVGGRNHGCGQNVWFEDGHAEFLNGCRLNARNDALYENDRGFVAAGIGPDDVVIGAAEATPRLAPTTLDATP